MCLWAKPKENACHWPLCPASLCANILHIYRTCCARTCFLFYNVRAHQKLLQFKRPTRLDRLKNRRHQRHLTTRPVLPKNQWKRRPRRWRQEEDGHWLESFSLEISFIFLNKIIIKFCNGLNIFKLLIAQLWPDIEFRSRRNHRHVTQRSVHFRRMLTLILL